MILIAVGGVVLALSALPSYRLASLWRVAAALVALGLVLEVLLSSCPVVDGRRRPLDDRRHGEPAPAALGSDRRWSAWRRRCGGSSASRSSASLRPDCPSSAGSCSPLAAVLWGGKVATDAATDAGLFRRRRCGWWSTVGFVVVYLFVGRSAILDPPHLPQAPAAHVRPRPATPTGAHSPPATTAADVGPAADDGPGAGDLLRPAAHRDRPRRATGGDVHDLAARGPHRRRRRADRSLPRRAARDPRRRAVVASWIGDERRRVRLGDGPAEQGIDQRPDGSAQHRSRHLAAQPAARRRPRRRRSQRCASATCSRRSSAGTTRRDRYVFVADGGHWENLGLVELLRRRCGDDPVHRRQRRHVGAFTTLRQAVELAGLELPDVVADIDLDRARSDQPPTAGVARRVVATLTVTYRGTGDEHVRPGAIHYAKAQLARTSTSPCAGSPRPTAASRTTRPATSSSPTSSSLRLVAAAVGARPGADSPRSSTPDH